MIFAPYDLALEKRHADGAPIRVGMLGAGNLARMVCLQLTNTTLQGIQLVAIANRTPEKAAALIREVGQEPRSLRNASELEANVSSGEIRYSDDPSLLTTSDGIDVWIDATGSVEWALQWTLSAIENGKHVVLANAELDSTLGPILKQKADRVGVVYTNIDGDEPGVAMNLIRYAKSIGLEPVAAGNLKGMVDFYRNPDTQKDFALQNAQNPQIVTSFADGTKLAMELAILANATGFKVGQPGMYGPACDHVNDVASLLPAEQMLEQGLVDYALGAAPYTGAFVVVHENDPARQKWLGYLKMGDGPFYVLYTPFHLPHIQAVASIGRAVETRDATVAPMSDQPVCQVISRAKKPMKAGDVLDGPGGFCSYGQIENFEPKPSVELGLPIALAEGCILKRDIAKDERILSNDVSRPTQSLPSSLWLEMVNNIQK